MDIPERPGHLEARFRCPRCGTETRRSVFPHLERVLIHARCGNAACQAPVSFVLDILAEIQQAWLRESPEDNTKPS